MKIYKKKNIDFLIFFFRFFKMIIYLYTEKRKHIMSQWFNTSVIFEANRDYSLSIAVPTSEQPSLKKKVGVRKT